MGSFGVSKLYEGGGESKGFGGDVSGKGEQGG